MCDVPWGVGASEDDTEMIGHSQVVKELYAQVCVLLCKQKGATEGILSRKLALVFSFQAT